MRIGVWLTCKIFKWVFLVLASLCQWVADMLQKLEVLAKEDGEVTLENNTAIGIVKEEVLAEEEAIFEGVQITRNFGPYRSMKIKRKKL